MKRIEDYRGLFNGIDTPVRLIDGSLKVPINFDNGATTPPFKYVDQVLRDSIEMYGAIHRGGQKALHSTVLYDKSKEKVLAFVNSKTQEDYCVIYVKNTTEGMNLLASELCQDRGMKILTTRMEHHANDLPWRRHGMPFYVDVDQTGQIKLDELEERLCYGQGTIKYVTVTGASNVTGYLSPIHQIARIAHRYGAYLIVDGAQLIAHREIDLKGRSEEAIDFLVFSAHKMYAPFGTGVVIGRRSILEACAPHVVGGGAVTAVFDDDVYFKHTPQKDEPGTPNFLGVMAMTGAIEMLEKVGMQEVAKHERVLTEKLLHGLIQIPGVTCYGDVGVHDRLGVAAFNIEGLHHSQVASHLAEYGGIAVRNGCFCAQPYVARLLEIPDKVRYELMLKPGSLEPGMVRASLGLYNTAGEVDIFLDHVAWIASHKKSF
ncbi:MAG: aminotransferase class V-fold PLP-dependent enzyme [Cellulosilyticaceae bacterium]